MASAVITMLAVFLSVNGNTSDPLTRLVELHEYAPLNVDTNLVGLPWYGLGQAYRWLALLLNALVLAGLVYLFAKEEAEFSNFLYVFAGINVGSLVLSLVLSPYIHLFSLVPIIALTVFLLARYCLVPIKRSVLVALLYQAWQILFLLIYRFIESKYA